MLSLFDSSPPKEVFVPPSATDATKDLATDQKIVKIFTKVAAIARKVTTSFAKMIATFPNTTTTFAKVVTAFTKVVISFAKVVIKFAKDATTFTKATTIFANIVAKFAKVTATFAKEVITFVKDVVTFGAISATFEPRASGGQGANPGFQNLFYVSVRSARRLSGELRGSGPKLLESEKSPKNPLPQSGRRNGRSLFLPSRGHLIKGFSA